MRRAKNTDWLLFPQSLQFTCIVLSLNFQSHPKSKFLIRLVSYNGLTRADRGDIRLGRNRESDTGTEVRETPWKSPAQRVQRPAGTPIADTPAALASGHQAHSLCKYTWSRFSLSFSLFYFYFLPFLNFYRIMLSWSQTLDNVRFLLKFYSFT